MLESAGVHDALRDKIGHFVLAVYCRDPRSDSTLSVRLFFSRLVSVDESAFFSKTYKFSADAICGRIDFSHDQGKKLVPTQIIIDRYVPEGPESVVVEIERSLRSAFIDADGEVEDSGFHKPVIVSYGSLGYQVERGGLWAIIQRASGLSSALEIYEKFASEYAKAIGPVK